MSTQSSRAETDSLRAALEALKRSNEELQEFAYAASHDLQEPLRTIASYLQLLERRYKDVLPPEARELMDFAVSGAQRMHTLINALLEYSRIGVGPGDLGEVDCAAVAGVALGQLKAGLDESGVRVSCLPLPRVKGNALLLQEVFQNLVSNAMKYRAETAPWIEIGCEERPGEWLFWVKDNGIGIEARFKERIFGIFQRLHSREKYPGAGMGLAVCRKAMERQGGRIWCESVEGKGSAFYFTLPKGEENHEHRDAQSQTAGR